VNHHVCVCYQFSTRIPITFSAIERGELLEDDDEAFQLWSDEVGVSVEHIKRLGEEDNFGTSGVTGPVVLARKFIMIFILISMMIQGL